MRAKMFPPPQRPTGARCMPIETAPRADVHARGWRVNLSTPSGIVNARPGLDGWMRVQNSPDVRAWQRHRNLFQTPA